MAQQTINTPPRQSIEAMFAAAVQTRSAANITRLRLACLELASAGATSVLVNLCTSAGLFACTGRLSQTSLWHVNFHPGQSGMEGRMWHNLPLYEAVAVVSAAIVEDAIREVGVQIQTSGSGAVQ